VAFDGKGETQDQAFRNSDPGVIIIGTGRQHRAVSSQPWRIIAVEPFPSCLFPAQLG
jgi:hypothetical protein